MATAFAPTSHLDPYATTRRMPLHPSGLILPIPMHMPTAFSALDTPRYYPHFTSLHPNFFESLHFGSGVGSMFSKPISNGALSSNLPTIVQPTPTKSIFDIRKNNVHDVTSAFTSSCLAVSSPITNTIASMTSVGTLSTTSTTSTTATTMRQSTAVVAKEDEVSSSEEIPSFKFNNSLSEQDAVFESAAKLLFLAVKWAKSIPTFNQISECDQSVLLEECWAELFIIMAAQYGLSMSSKEKIEYSEKIEKLSSFIFV